MDLVSQFFNTQSGISLPAVLITIVAGVATFALFAGLLTPPSGRTKNITTAVAAKGFSLNDIQASLDKAQINISATEYVKRSLMFGIPVGLGLVLLIGSGVLIIVGVVAGFIIQWTKLEQERDKQQVRYTKQLASACDTIRTAYGVNPSLKKALEAVAEYGQSPVKEDFQEVLVAASQERLVEGLQTIADRRRSIVFDTVATSLIRASEASGEVNDMLVRLADSTRQNVAAFEDALMSQLNARSSIQWGTYGPWMIFCVFRVITVAMSASTGSNLFGPLSSFFTTFGGNAVALGAALISIFVYRYAIGVSQRGLVVRRVSMTEATVRLGQKPLSAQQPLSAQSRPVTVN
jgi:hypothetical protein